MHQIRHRGMRRVVVGLVVGLAAGCSSGHSPARTTGVVSSVPATSATTPPTPSPSNGTGYVSPSRVEADALRSVGCPVPPDLSGRRDQLSGQAGCDSASVKLFGSFGQAEQSQPGLVQPGGATPTTAIYLVSLHGRLPFSESCACQVAPTVSHLNELYNARTGQWLGGGTAGTPLR